jgi:hypothetical protein
VLTVYLVGLIRTASGRGLASGFGTGFVNARLIVSRQELVAERRFLPSGLLPDIKFGLVLYPP